MPSGSIPQHESSSDTKAGIAQGTINVRNNPDQDLSGIDRKPTLDSQALKNPFDAQKVSENQELGQVAGRVGFHAAGDLAGQMGWVEGSKERVVLHGLVGAAMAALGGGDALQGGLGAAANQAAIPVMEKYLKDQGYDPRSPEFATLIQLGSTAMGAAVGGGSGAASALDGTKYNYLTHAQRDQQQKDLNQCGDDADCRRKVYNEWDQVSGQQSVAMASSLAGSLTSEQALQLRDTRPGGVAYDAILGQASNQAWQMAYANGNQIGMLNAALANALVTARDGMPLIGSNLGPSPTELLIARNRLEIGLLGPVFGGPGAATDVLGGTPQQVSGANQAGGIAFVLAGTKQWGGLGQTSMGPVSARLVRPALNVGIKWGQGIQNQGMPWENYLVTQLPVGSRLPQNFKTFDFYNISTRVAISAKTLDTMMEGKLMNPSRVYSSLKGNIDTAASFYKPFTLSGQRLSPDMISSRELQIAVPLTTTREQWVQIDRAIQYGKDNGVKVIVTSVSN